MDKPSLLRTIILIIALLNQVLVSFNISPIPISDDQVEVLVSTGFTVVISLWTWWKNNYISKKGQKQKEVLQQHGLYKK